MSLANLALTNTFDEWRIRTNQLVTEVNDINANTIATFISNNAGLTITTSPIRKGNIYFQLNVSTVTSDTASFNLASALSVNLVSNNATFANTVATTAYNQANAANVLAFNTGIGANAYATAAAAGANTYLLATIAGANAAVGTGANTYLLTTLAGANAAVGTGANTYLLATLTGANTITSAAYDKANAANVLAFTASQTATIASGAYDKANSANILAFQVGGAVTTANLNNGVTFDKANAANFLAFTANVTANYANVLARTALELASLAVSNNTPALALSVAQSAFGFANTVNVATVASFGVANAALPNTTVTLNGSLLANAYVNTTSGFYSVSTGTALRPAYSWTTDNFTGMYRVGANTVGFSTAAASRLVIDANGFVGIGTTTPSKLLEISGGSSEVFVGTGSISGNVLTISSVVSGQINVGHYVTDEGLNVLGGTYVKEYFGGTGGLGTYNLTASQATVTSTTIYAFNMHNNTFRITGTDTTVNPGQPIGMIEFASNDSDLTADERSRAFVYAVNEQANAGATLMFGTAIGSRESTERLRINRFGAVGIDGANFGTAGQTLQSNGSGSPPLWVNNFAFDKANAANVLAFNTGIGANAFASATVAGANAAVGGGANAFATAAAAGANAYMIAVQNGSNTYLLTTIAGANTAVGTGANTYLLTTLAGANTYLLATLSGANTAVGGGANAFATAATAGANAYMIAVQNGANTAVGTGANTYLLATLSGANTAVGTGANTYLLTTLAGANAAVGAGANTVAVAAFAKANATTYTSNVVISVADNTNAALRITQTGTGNALLVEDSANPDSTPFVVDVTGNVGIGTTAPVYQLDAFAASGGVTGSFRTNGATGSDYGNIQAVAGGYFSNFIQYGSGVSVFATTGTQLTVQTNGAGPITFVTNSVERARIDGSSGNVLIGRTNSTVGQGVKLDVNGAANTSDILVNGTSVSPLGQHTIWVPAVSMYGRLTNGAVVGTLETSTNRVMIKTMDFDTTTQEFAQFAIQMPKSWNENSLICQFVWSHANTITNYGVSWNVAAVAITNADALDATFGTAITVSDTGGTNNAIYISDESAAVTVAGAPGAEEYVLFQVSRWPAGASDTLGIDSRLHGVKIHYTVDAAKDD